MQLSERGERFIKNHEGLRLKKYQDEAGIWTVGYGHVIKEGEHLDTITQAKAEELFDADAAGVMKVLKSKVKVSLKQGQIDALASFIFNLGGGAFTGSTLLKRLNVGNYSAASKELDRWVMVRDKKTKKLRPSAGLITRRADERKMFDGAAFAVAAPPAKACPPCPTLPIQAEPDEVPPEQPKPAPTAPPPPTPKPSKKAQPQKPKG